MLQPADGFRSVRSGISRQGLVLVACIARNRATIAGLSGRCRAWPFLAWVAVMVTRALSSARSPQVSGSSSLCSRPPHSSASWVTVRWGLGQRGQEPRLLLVAQDALAALVRVLLSIDEEARTAVKGLFGTLAEDIL